MKEPLTQEQIVQILQEEKWNLDDPNDLIDLIRAVEKAHGIEPRGSVSVTATEGWHKEWVPDSESWYEP